QLAVAGPDFVFDRRRPACAVEERTNASADVREARAVRERGKFALDALLELVLAQERAVGGRGRGEAARNADARRLERADELAERRVLASDVAHVGDAD